MDYIKNKNKLLKMIENTNQLLLLILSVILITILLMKCDPDGKLLPMENKQEIVIEHKTDTIIVFDTIYLLNKQSIVKRDENNRYDDSLHKNYYYNQTFQDSSYLLQTYGGFVDSIKLDLYKKEIFITDSIIKTITNTVFVPSKGLYIGGDINVLDGKMVAPEVMVGYMFKNQTMLKAGVGIFNKQPTYSIGFMMRF